MQTEIVIEVVTDAEFAIDLIGEEVEVARWPFPERWPRPYDWQTDGVTAPQTQGVDHETSRIDSAVAGRYHDYGVRVERAAA